MAMASTTITAICWPDFTAKLYICFLFLLLLPSSTCCSALWPTMRSKSGKTQDIVFGSHTKGANRLSMLEFMKGSKKRRNKRRRNGVKAVWDQRNAERDFHKILNSKINSYLKLKPRIHTSISSHELREKLGKTGDWCTFAVRSLVKWSCVICCRSAAPIWAKHSHGPLSRVL